MSIYAHVMCEKCLRKSKLIYHEDVDLTDAHKGRLCCWCRKIVNQYSLIVHRHRDAVPCEGKHG